MIKIGEVRRRGKQSISHQPFSVRNQCEKFRISFASPKLSANSMRKILHQFRITHSQCELSAKIFAPLILNAKNFALASHCHYSMQKISHRQFASGIPISHHPIAMRNANGHLMAKRKAKSHLNFLFKGL